jgi:hypothetical protein
MKSPELTKGKIISPAEQRYSHINYPVFCFKYLHRDYHLDNCTDSEKKNLIDQLVQISGCTWKQLQLSPRHGIGSEKLSISSLKTNLPISFTEEVKNLLAFRFDGKKSFVGFRDGFLFHIFLLTGISRYIIIEGGRIRIKGATQGQTPLRIKATADGVKNYFPA